LNEKEIKNIYRELQGYLKQAPEPRSHGEGMSDDFIWNNFHQTIDRLNKASDNNYDIFKVKIHPPDRTRTAPYIRIVEYRQQLQALIYRLQSEYFPEEIDETKTQQGIVISQSQQQSQQVFIQMILDVQSKIDEKLSSLPEGSNEKTFFQKLKGSLSATSGIVDLLNKIFTFAKDSGISTDQLTKLFT
jgi:hypothetical protein